MKKILLVILLLVIGSEVYGDEKKCLTENIYFEARGQGQAGWLAVAQVTLNRVEDRRFPNTVCEVVKQGLTYASGQPIRNKCQFSWYCDGKSDVPLEHEKMIYEESFELAVKLLEERPMDFTEGAVHYHSDSVNPWWAEHMVKTTRIDNHIFYKRK